MQFIIGIIVGLVTAIALAARAFHKFFIKKSYRG